MRWERAYPPQDESASAARRDAATFLADAGLDAAALDDVQIVVSELVANAIRHAATDLAVRLDLGAERVRVEVFDGDTRPPALLSADADATSGRGLVIVAAVATSWGFESADRDAGSGKVVWAEIRFSAS